jgi:peptidoglycan/LPS O-acetylase OafA/YrhL
MTNLVNTPQNKQFDRNLGLDLLKVLAVFLITNSHFKTLYEDVNPALATGGVPGDALFFFASGFALTLGNSAKSSYIGFVKNKLRRLLPTFIVWNIMANIFSLKEIGWEDFLLVPEYWFIQCIFIMYLLIFPFIHMGKRTFLYLMSGSVMILLLVMAIFPYPDRSVFNDITLRYFCFLTPFIFGLYCGINNERIKENSGWKDGLWGILLFCSYFVVVSFGKCKENWMYYTEIFALVPLNLFMYYLYRFFNIGAIGKKIKGNQWLYFCVRFLSLLTLQIYVVQFYLITDRFNQYFPLNILIVTSIIFVFAYILNVFTKLFEQTLSKEAWDLRKAFSI